MGRFKGTSMPENSLTLGLVTLICVLALSLTGGSIRDTFATVTREMQLPWMSDSGSDQDGGSGGGSGPGQGNSGRQKNVTMTLADGTVVTLPNYPDNLAQSVETVGANGTTEELAKFIALTAEKLKAAGEIDETQYLSLIRLSNQGFKISGIQAKVQQAFETNLNNEFSQGNDWEYGTELQKLGISVIQTGFEPEYGVHHTFMIPALYSDDTTPGSLENSASYDFTDLGSNTYPSIAVLEYQVNNSPDISQMGLLLEIARRQGALNNPKTKALVEFATRDIVRLANASGNAFNNQEIADNVKQSQRDSTSICDAGNGNANSGVSCQ